MSWARIEKLMLDNNVSAYRLSKETGLTQANFTAWKAGRSKPGFGAIVKIADYFNVSVRFLTGDTDNPSPDLQDTVDMTDLELDDELTTYKYALHSATGKLSTEGKKQVLDFARFVYEKQINDEKKKKK